MNNEHHPKEVLTNNVGATQDIDKELSGNQTQGKYFDSENGRVSSDRGNKAAWEKIRGENVEHSNTTTGTWFNLVSAKINKDIFELWVETTNTFAPKIVINGSIMGSSVDMPWLYANRVQFDVNENCLGGEIFLTDFNVAPMIFNIKDIKDNFSPLTSKYFADFNPNLYYINLDAPLNIPVFRELVNLGGGGGLPVGSYQYSLRFSNDSGDKTNWGVQTPPIPVLQSIDTSTTYTQYHGVKSYGDEPNLISPTSYGVKLKFRVNNENNYQYIEIRRISYNFSASIDFIPQGTIIAKIPISAGELSIREFIDPSNANIEEEILADNEESYELSNIEKAKAIRYYDKKVVLMNYNTSSKETAATITDINGEKIIPVLKDIGTLGFNKPLHHVYHKNYPSGEKYSFGVNMFDGGGGQGFVFEDDDLKNIQVPNRRDVMSSDSFDLSSFDKPGAATVDSGVDAVFEIFSHENAINKFTESKKNISMTGSKGGTDAADVGYQPLRPVNKDDIKVDHDYRINNAVRDSADTEIVYDPFGFQLDYYSKGFAIGGVTDLPSWVKSFSIVRSQRADRVICQGIGMYNLTTGEFGTSAATKEKDKFWFHSPDIESGLISQSVIDDINANPANYSIQLVSPLGFFSEVYNFSNKLAFPNRDRIIDMITYARILHDEGDINPNEDAAMGIDGAGKRYVAYNRYRNTVDTAGDGAFAGDNGNKIFTLSSFAPLTSGRSTYYDLGITEDIYNIANTGGFGDNDFDDTGMKTFTEPFYIVNIIQTGKVVEDFNINSYLSTGHYQKLKSLIGIGNGNNNQTYELVDERWEDCCPSLASTDYNSNGESFIYLTDTNGVETTYLNVTFYTAGDILIIQTAITNDGFYITLGGKTIVGIYTHSSDVDEVVTVNFSYPAYNPQSGYKIHVKYDESRPIIFFGGDTVVGENIFSPIDNEADDSNSDTDGQFVMNIGFPYRRYDLNENYFINEDHLGNEIQASDKCRLGYLRQLCVMYAVESVTATNFEFNSDFPLAYFPLTHYIMRPLSFDDSSFAGGVAADIAADNEIYEEYFDDYPQEWTLWKFGGFRFLPQENIDYSVIGPFRAFSKPDVGFEEINDFCTGVTWSLSRATNQQDSPGLKTFLASNKFFLDDDSGEIKKAWNDRTEVKGDNLYAITESGVCLLLTKKSILSNLNADDLSTTASLLFISAQYWISREIGSNDEMWRGMADSLIELISDEGGIEKNALFIPNSHSVYRLTDNQLVDILKNRYRTRLKPSLEAVLPSYNTKVTGHFDKVHNEYWLQIPDANDGSLDKCFVYAQDTGYWVGRFRYRNDSYLFFGGKNYGFRNLKMYELDKGFLINGNPITAYLIPFFAKTIETEFISIEINSGARGTMKPTEVVFMDENEIELARLDASLYGTAYLQQRDGWWNQVPRKNILISPQRDRIQLRLHLFKIIHSFEEDFKVVSSTVQYKALK